VNVEIISGRHLTIIHKDSTLGRAWGFDVRKPGEAKHCAADKFADPV
jgi:hypothetical protein